VKKLLTVDQEVVVNALNRQRKIIQQDLKRLKDTSTRNPPSSFQSSQSLAGEALIHFVVIETSWFSNPRVLPLFFRCKPHIGA